MGFIRWGGKKYYPQKPKPYQADINELMKPLSEKVNKGNVWGSQIMNVQKGDAVPVSPTPTPSITPTPTPTPTPIPVPTVELVSSATSTTIASTYTFNTQYIGDGGGAICVAIVANGNGDRFSAISSSINGVAAPTYGKSGSQIGGICPSVGLIWLDVTGTSTANISITFTGNMNACKIYTYRIKNVNSTDPLVLGDAAGDSTSIQINNGSQPGDSLGVIVAAAADLSAPIPTLSFTNATLEDIYNTGFGTIGAVGTFDETAAGTLTMDFNSNESTILVALNLVYN